MIDEVENNVIVLSAGKVGTSDGALRSLQTTGVRLMGLNCLASAVRRFYDCGDHFAAPIFRALCSLKEKVKQPGKCRGNVELRTFKTFGKQPIRASTLKRV